MITCRRQEMSAWRLHIFIIITFSSSVNSIFDLDSTLALARCRASCLYKMQISRVTDLECQGSFHCSQCWEACVAVKPGSRIPACVQTDCGPGCLEACRLHSISPSHMLAVPLKEVLVLNEYRVSWSPMPGSTVVYVVMVDGSELCQTVDTNVILPPDVDSSTVRVLVVEWHGLVSVLAPLAESPLDQTLDILRSVGLESNPVFMINSEHNKGLFVNTLTAQGPMKKVWRLQLESLNYQLPLVLATISWQRHHHQLLKNNQLIISYLVTWSESSGLLRGNLLTNTSSITLSLVPDTHYRIQVSVLNERSSKLQSELLDLDTRQVYSKSSNSTNILRRFGSSVALVTPKFRDFNKQFERIEGVAAVFLVFLGLVAVSAWRWRYRSSSPKRKLLDERMHCPGLVRVIAPSRRILLDVSPKADFPSSENLLPASYVSN